MRYAVWNNKGGVGKTFLSFMLGTEYAKRNPDKAVILVDMCPQANLSEIVLGGNGIGNENLEALLGKARTIGGYFSKRIISPHTKTGNETDYLVQAFQYNKKLPQNLYLICGDPSLEIQAQVINQIGGQTLPVESWKNVHGWLKDVLSSCIEKVGGHDKVVAFIDCNPSFSAYTELALLASERIIVPCSSDGSSARAVDNIGELVYGIGVSEAERVVSFHEKANRFGMGIPIIHSIILNRSTQYDKKASKAFSAMFESIKKRVEKLKHLNPQVFLAGAINFEDMPDNHSISVVCSHNGYPLYEVEVGKHPVHDEVVQVNAEPLERYKTSLNTLMTII